MGRRLLLRVICVLIGIGVFHVRADNGTPTPSPQADVSSCVSFDPRSPIAFSHNDQFAVQGWREGEAHVWDITTGSLVYRFQQSETTHGISGVAFSSDDQWVATADWYTVNIWSMATGQLQWSFQHDLYDDVTPVAFLPGNTQLFVGGGLGAKIYDLTTGEMLAYFPGYMEYRYGEGAELSSDSHYVLTSDWNAHEGYLWDTTALTRVRTFEHVARMTFLSVDEILLYEGEDGSYNLVIWNMHSDEAVTLVPLGAAFVENWRASSNQQYLWITKNIGQEYPIFEYEIWDIPSRSRLYTSASWIASVTGAFLESPGMLAQYIWDQLTDAPRHHFSGIYPNVVPNTTHDGRYQIAATVEGDMAVWDVETGQIVHRLC